MSKPTINELAAATTQSQEQISTAVNDQITGVLNDLISGKNPLSSKTLIANGVMIIAGVAGTCYQAWATGDMTSIAPFLTLVATGAINTVLRFLTTGPVITDGMQRIQDALLKTEPPK